MPLRIILITLALLPVLYLTRCGTGMQCQLGMVCRSSSGGGINFTGPTGVLDTSFGAAGYAATSLPVYDIVAQSDGSILTAEFGADFTVQRFSADGILDTSFGTAGTASTDFTGGNDRSYAVSLQSSGKIVLGGYATNATFDIGATRYNTDGSLDTSFGVNGKATIDFGAGETAFGMTVQPDDKILLGGSNAATDYSVVRLNVDGALDTSFGVAGMASVDFGASDLVWKLIVQPDGKILVGGYGTTNVAMARFNSDGSIDTSFGSSGKVTTGLNGNTGYKTGFALSSSGYIFMSEWNAAGNGATTKYSPNGALVTSFGTAGVAGNGIAGSAQYSLALQPDGKILAMGKKGGLPYWVTISRFNSDGTLDSSFGSAGNFVNSVAGFADQILCGSIQYTSATSGKLLVAGVIGSTARIARFQ